MVSQMTSTFLSCQTDIQLWATAIRLGKSVASRVLYFGMPQQNGSNQLILGTLLFSYVPEGNV